MESPSSRMALVHVGRVSAIWIVLIFAGCSQPNDASSKSGEEGARSQSGVVQPNTETDLRALTSTRTLSEVRINVQGGATSWRPDTQDAVEAALFRSGRFESDSYSDTCKADLSVYFAMTSNGHLVETARAGTALVGTEAMIHCRKNQAFETFRVELKETRNFKEASDKEIGTIYRDLLQEVVDRAAEQLLGQVLVRPLGDEDIIQVLSEESRAGKLMEAAIEAGERGLVKAIPQLVMLTKHSSAVVRLRAAAALGLLKTATPEVIRALAGLTEGAKNEQVAVAVAALSDIGGPKAIRYLSNIAVSHPDEVVRALARAGAEKIKAQAR